jgi:hypothetical protein
VGRGIELIDRSGFLRRGPVTRPRSQSAWTHFGQRRFAAAEA